MPVSFLSRQTCGGGCARFPTPNTNFSPKASSGSGTRPRGNLCILFHARSRTRYLVPTGRNNNLRRNDAFQDRCLATNPADQGKGVLAEPILRPGSANSPRVRRRGSVSTNKLRRVRLHSHEPGASGARRRFVELALIKRPLVRGRDGANCDGSSATTDEPLGSALTKRRRRSSRPAGRINPLQSSSWCCRRFAGSARRERR